MKQKGIIKQLKNLFNKQLLLIMELLDLDTKKSNSHKHLLKLQALRDCFNGFIEVTNQKLYI